MTKTRDLADLGGGFIQAGSGAVQRTVESKLQDVVSVKDFGAVGDGVADDTAAIQAAFNSGSKVISFSNKDTYRFTSQLTVPTGVTVLARGVTLQCDYSQTGTSAALIFNAGCKVDELRLNLAAGRTFRRFVAFDGDCSIDRAFITSADQINNRTDSNDGAVKLSGDNISIGSLHVSNFDNSVDATLISKLSADTITAESYVRAFHFEQCSLINVSCIKAYTASVNASTTPGHNGLLLEEVTDSCFGTVSISNSGEHAVRIGSGVTAASQNISFGTIQAISPGQCGFKINDGTYFTRGISVGSIHTVDCAATTLTGSNEDSVRIERAKDISIGSILATKVNKSTSANVGLYINGSERLTVGTLQIEAPNQYGLHVEDVAGEPNASISIGVLNVFGGGVLPVYINSPSEQIKDIVIHNGYFRDCLNNAANIQIVNTGGTPEPCIFSVKVNVTGWTSPGSVVAADLLSDTAGSGRIYNLCTPYN